MTSRMFHIGDLLSITDGQLVSPRHMEGIYDIVDFVTGASHMTHQLPRAVGEVVRPWLLMHHPWLNDVTMLPEGAAADESVYRAWMELTVAQWGEQHLVEALREGAYENEDPIAELRRMAPHIKIIPVVLPQEN